jgi:hypothetical protein
MPPKPRRAPSQADLRAREDSDELVAESVTQVRDSAEKCRTRMAALVTLVTTALLLKGLEKAADLPTNWRIQEPRQRPRHPYPS